MNLGIYEPFAISLGLGLLVDLQREWKGSEIAGIRTFPLLTLLGTTAAIVAGDEFAWLTAAGLLAVAILLVVANVAKWKEDEFDAGMTTEVAPLLT